MWFISVPIVWELLIIIQDWIPSLSQNREPVQLPSQTESVANGAFKKLLSEDWDWLMPAVRAIDQGKAQDINKTLTYKLPLDAENGRVYLDKSPNLNEGQLSALEKLGSPSQLRLMYLAEGWI